jgi:hypothetical protein
VKGETLLFHGVAIGSHCGSDLPSGGPAFIGAGNSVPEPVQKRCGAGKTATSENIHFLTVDFHFRFSKPNNRV